MQRKCVAPSQCYAFYLVKMRAMRGTQCRHAFYQIYQALRVRQRSSGLAGGIRQFPSATLSMQGINAGQILVTGIRNSAGRRQLQDRGVIIDCLIVVLPEEAAAAEVAATVLQQRTDPKHLTLGGATV